MAKVKDKEIEKTLRRVVRDAVRRDEAIAPNGARARAEKELGLAVGYLKSDPKWKSKSKEIITAAFNESGEPETNEEPKQTPKDSSKREPDPNPPLVEKAEGFATHESDEEDGDGSENETSGSSETDDKTNEVESPVAAREALPVKGLTKKAQVGPPKVNGVKRKSDAQTSSDSESEEESDDQTSESETGDETGEPQQKKTKTYSASQVSKGGPDDKSADESEDPESYTGRPVKTSSNQSLQAIPPHPFKPPHGYVEITPDQFSHDTVLSQSNLEGKQIWHITAPANIPFSSITELARSAIQTPTPTLKHNGAEYTLNEPSSAAIDSLEVLLPTDTGYERVSQKIGRTLQLQQIITLPNLTSRQADQNSGSTAAANIAQPSVSHTRPQPRDLRMRYKPPGFGPGRAGTIGSDSESADDEGEQVRDGRGAGAVFQFPRSLGAHGVAATTTTTTQEGDGDVAMVDADADEIADEDARRRARREEKKAKKNKKEKKEKRRLDEGVEAEVNGSTETRPLRLVDNTSTKKKRKEEVHENDVSPAQTLTMITNGNGSPSETPTKAEKLKRKEEKRLKKEKRAAK